MTYNLVRLTDAWAGRETAHNWAETAHNWAETAHNWAETAHNWAETAHNWAETAHNWSLLRRQRGASPAANPDYS